MSSDGPPKKDEATPTQDPPVTIHAPTGVSLEQAIRSPSDTSDPLGSRLTATGVTSEETQTKSSEPPVSSIRAFGGSGPTGSVSAEPTIEQIQAQAKTQYSAISLQLPMGQGEFKQILPFLPKIAVAVTKKRALEDEMTREKTMLDRECAQLRFLSNLHLPALRVHGDPFVINSDSSGRIKYGVLMDAIPKHTFIDTKDPATLNTFLPSILLNVEIPRGEAWYMKRAQIETAIARNLSNPTALEQAKGKAKALLIQLEQIAGILKANNIAIVDLQLTVEPDGKITIIDPLDVVRPLPSNKYKSMITQEIIDNSDFTRKVVETQAMMDRMIKYCNDVIKANPKELPTLITPILGSSSGMSVRVDPAMRHESKSGHLSLGTIDEGDAPDAPSSGPSRSGAGYRPSSRATSIVFSQMPAPAPLPSTATSAPKKGLESTVKPKDPKGKPPEDPSGNKCRLM
ncbi:MAG: hypothetical protein BGO43_00760 [Gammaproteobacteria bacterium 39-13]|nr:hypothetical protein [Gammaproteobacteria bacterium]OJV96786.1 MAG: hypothetical protein BGO43_00760 [Gammaproteobacteria bacterium 39-13]